MSSHSLSSCAAIQIIEHERKLVLNNVYPINKVELAAVVFAVMAQDDNDAQVSGDQRDRSRPRPGKNKNQKDSRKRPPTQKLTKEERRLKYTQIARQRQTKERLRTVGRNSICYKCRRRGHTVGNCPENNKTDATSAKSVSESSHQRSNRICYKCGSTEHGLFQCPNYDKSSDTAQELPFATCFVCNAKGHLASACPENSHGVYIHGGACRICGSKRHRQTECPQAPSKQKDNQNKDESDSDTGVEHSVNLLEGTGDDLILPKEETVTAKSSKPTPKKKRRVVKF